MLTDDKMIDLLKESFDADTRAVAASPRLPQAVRSRLRRRRAGRAAALGTTGLAAAALVGSVALGGAGSGTGHGTSALPGDARQGESQTRAAVVGTKTVQLSGFRFSVPADATVTKTCLPDSFSDAYAHNPVQGEVFALLGDGQGHVATTAAGNPCIGAVLGFTEYPPAATQQITTPGEPTVFLTASEPGAQTGYRMLSGRDAITAASVVGGGPGPYALVMSIPADNDQVVLVAGLRQYHPGGN